MATWALITIRFGASSGTTFQVCCQSCGNSKIKYVQLHALPAKPKLDKNFAGMMMSTKLSKLPVEERIMKKQERKIYEKG